MIEQQQQAQGNNNTGITSDQKLALIDYLAGIINEQRCDLLQQVLSNRTRYITVVLEDIYHSQNASAVLRTCECLGLQELHIIENEHAYRLNPDVVRGSSKWIELVRHNNATNGNTNTCLENLKRKKYKIAAMTPGEDAMLLDDVPVNEKIALCFGTEETGLSDAAIEMADYMVKIPMHGFTQSFNLSVSAGISLYLLTRKIRSSGADWQLDQEDKIDLYIDWLVKSTPTGNDLMKRFLEEYQ